MIPKKPPAQRKQKDNMFEGCTHATYVFQPVRKTRCRQVCSCCWSLTNQSNWAFRIWSTWQVSPRGRCLANRNPATTSTACPELCFLIMSEEKDRGEKTQEGNSTCSKLCHHMQPIDQKAQRMSPEKSRKVTLPLHLWIDSEESKLFSCYMAAQSQQPAARPSSSDLQMLLIYPHCSL